MPVTTHHRHALDLTRGAWRPHATVRTTPPAACAELEHTRRARDAALHALADIQHRAAMASHDLRQPVHALVLLAEGIALRTNDPALQPAVAQLRRVALSMKSLCDTILDEGRGRQPARPRWLETAELQALVADVLSTCQEPAGQRGLRLRSRLSRACAQVHADPVLLRQALVNLVSNAVRYTRRGSVLVALRLRGDTLRWEIHDTGVGIAGADLAGLFEPYQRGPQATQLDGSEPGLGLGLAIVSHCARLLGSDVGVRSIPGRGSCFWLSLPAAPVRGAVRIGRSGALGPIPHAGGACPQGQTAKAQTA